MTDIDGYCHINGHKLFLEWKTPGTDVPAKQLDAFKALSYDATVVLAWGDPVEMRPVAFRVLQDGLTTQHVREGDVCAEFDMAITRWGQAATFAQAITNRQQVSVGT